MFLNRWTVDKNTNLFLCIETLSYILFCQSHNIFNVIRNNDGAIYEPSISVVILIYIPGMIIQCLCVLKFMFISGVLNSTQWLFNRFRYTRVNALRRTTAVVSYEGLGLTVSAFPYFIHTFYISLSISIMK